MQLIFEKSVKGRRGLQIPESDVETAPKLRPELKRKEKAALPDLSELDVVRHFTALSTQNFSIDTNFYPLGSCTMKYNPRINERVGSWPHFAGHHPFLPHIEGGESAAQGNLELLANTEDFLSELTGMAAYTLEPLAGAHGELTGILLMAAYHNKKGNHKERVLVPDNAHGTNPASASIGGYTVETVPSNDSGYMDLDALKATLDDDVAGIMLTNPNTLGIFNPHIVEISELVHSVDGLLYYDGANLNAIMGKLRPGDAGFDIVHLNLHKTFSTPHGGGGPGSGPIGVSEGLVDFLPVPRVSEDRDQGYSLDFDPPDSIGHIAPFYGNFLVIVRAYTYMLMQGADGLENVAENAVLNANYLKEKLKDTFNIPYSDLCKHECVLSAEGSGVQAVDIAKGLLDEGLHAPTVYFPMIVPESMMVEPTETESKETIDTFIEAMKKLAEIARTDPERLHAAPQTTPVKRLDETKAAREVNIASV